MRTRIGFIGAGQMAQALARGFVASGKVAGEQIFISDPNPAVREIFLRDLPEANLATDNLDLLAKTEIVFLAVKPQMMALVTDELQGAVSSENEKTLFVSIAAGLPLDLLTTQLGTKWVIRVMPNTPCLVRQCAAAYCGAAGATEADLQQIGELLQSVGVAVEVEERLMDAVTGMAGSGPAYIYTIIEALSDGGVRAGLPRATATHLAAQTVLGAAQMVLETGEHPAVLRDRVTSPGGTTIAGIAALEQNSVRAGIMAAVQASEQRAKELACGMKEK